MTVRRNVDVIMKEIKVLICSARKNVSEYFSGILNSWDIMTEIARNYTEADAVIKKTQPDIVLTDALKNSDYDGIAITEAIFKNHPRIKCALFTDNVSGELAAEAYCAGAKECFLPDTDENYIRGSIRNIFEDDDYLGRIIGAGLRNELKNIKKYKERLVLIASRLNKLTKTELSILRLICIGEKQKDIAEMRNTELGTVKFHVHNILKKMSFNNTGEMIDALKESELLVLIN